jgi:bifunctional non-homologous end joining protein LigD
MQRRNCRLFTRRDCHWTARVSSFREALGKLNLDSAIIDGEIMVADDEGRSDFHALQADIAKGRSDRRVARSVR